MCSGHIQSKAFMQPLSHWRFRRSGTSVGCCWLLLNLTWTVRPIVFVFCQSQPFVNPLGIFWWWDSPSMNQPLNISFNLMFACSSICFLHANYTINSFISTWFTLMFNAFAVLRSVIHFFSVTTCASSEENWACCICRDSWFFHLTGPWNARVSATVLCLWRRWPH